jgi:hypothetical protein
MGDPPSVGHEVSPVTATFSGLVLQQIPVFVALAVHSTTAVRIVRQALKLIRREQLQAAQWDRVVVDLSAPGSARRGRRHKRSMAQRTQTTGVHDDDPPTALPLPTSTPRSKLMSHRSATSIPAHPTVRLYACEPCAYLERRTGPVFRSSALGAPNGRPPGISWCLA